MGKSKVIKDIANDMSEKEIEIPEFPYAENYWGMYKMHGFLKDVIDTLLKYREEYADDVHICLYTDNKHHNDCDDIFDTDNVSLYIYYRKKNKELRKSLEDDEVISAHWSDTDLYAFDESDTKRIIDQEKRAIPLLKKVILLSNEFNQLVYED